MNCSFDCIDTTFEFWDFYCWCRLITYCCARNRVFRKFRFRCCFTIYVTFKLRDFYCWCCFITYCSNSFSVLRKFCYSCFVTIDTTCKFWDFHYWCCFITCCSNSFSVLRELSHSCFVTIDTTCKFWDFMDCRFVTIKTIRKFSTYHRYWQVMHTFNCTRFNSCNFLTDIFRSYCK